MFEHDNRRTTENTTARRFGVICRHCNALSLVDLDHEPAQKQPTMTDVKRINYSFERLQHMRITLKLSRKRMSEHLLMDDELQKHLDSHVVLLEEAYQWLGELQQSYSKHPRKPEVSALVEMVNI